MKVKDVYELLNDAEFFEGFVGALGTIVSFFVFRKIFSGSKNMGIVLGLTFITTWVIRKMGMNVYKHIKAGLKQTDKEWNISELYDLSQFDNPKRAFYVIIGTFFALIAIIAVATSHNVVTIPNMTIYLLYCVGFFSLIHYSN